MPLNQCRLDHALRRGAPSATSSSAPRPPSAAKPRAGRASVPARGTRLAGHWATVPSSPLGVGPASMQPLPDLARSGRRRVRRRADRPAPRGTRRRAVGIVSPGYGRVGVWRVPGPKAFALVDGCRLNGRRRPADWVPLLWITQHRRRTLSAELQKPPSPSAAAAADIPAPLPALTCNHLVTYSDRGVDFDSLVFKALSDPDTPLPARSSLRA